MAAPVHDLKPRLEQTWDYDMKWGMRLVAESSWGPLRKVAAAAHHTPRHGEGMRACLRLIDAHWLPEKVREQAYRSLSEYADPLATLWPGAVWRTLRHPGDGRQTMISPGPAAVSDGLVATVLTRAADGQEMTWSLLAVDRDLQAAAATPLRDETRRGQHAPATASSFEQVAPFVHEERVQAMVTVSDRNPRGVAQTGLAAIEDGALCTLRLLSNPANGRHERDWSPLPAADGVHAVSWWEPTETLRIEPGSGAVERAALRLAPRLAERFQGASAGVDVPGGWLVLVNERYDARDTESLVFSRFVLVGNDFQVTAISPHFWVAARGDDAASGLTRQGDDLIAGFTSCGQHALLARIPLSAVLDSLLPLEFSGANAAPPPGV